MLKFVKRQHKKTKSVHGSVHGLTIFVQKKAMIKFYLRDKKSISSTAIMMTVFYENDRMKIATGCSIPPKMWQEKKQRSKVTIEFHEANEINDKLDLIESVMLSLLKKYRDENYYPSPAKIKADLLKQNQVPLKSKNATTFWDYFDRFIEDKRKLNPDVRDYNNSLRKHLQKTELVMGKKLSFQMIANESSEFNLEWMNYLSFTALNSEGEPGLMPNTIGKQNKNLKAFFNWCFDKNIVSKFSLKAYPTIMEDVDKIYLSEADLNAIEQLKLDNKEQQIVRDLFLIGCETGLRFSDFTRITEHDIRNNELHIIPKKTKNAGVKKLIIPMSLRFQEIFERYNGILPNYDKNHLTKFNKTIREIAEQAKLFDEIKFYREIAGETVTVSKKKFEEVSSHTCRRTFCTLKFLKGMPAQAIMKFSGHQTERSFLKYLKLDAELTAKKYAGYF
jgi:integrase